MQQDEAMKHQKQLIAIFKWFVFRRFFFVGFFVPFEFRIWSVRWLIRKVHVNTQLFSD